MMTEPAHEIEFWADSFHEGDWACTELRKHLPLIDVSYAKGFMPIFRYCLPDGKILTIRVYGSYRSWTPLPGKIGDLLVWGKPDIICYVPSTDTILFAVEETAAVQTGNQNLQRYERVYGSARSKIPFWYLNSEYGLHIDGGIRRDSIWPSVAALKLTAIQGSPCVVVHFSTESAPESYEEGIGVDSLFSTLSKYLLWWLGYIEEGVIEKQLAEQYKSMLAFIKSQWRSIVNYLPGEELLLRQETAELFARRALGKVVDFPSREFLFWGRVSTLPLSVRLQLTAKTLIKPDPLIPHLENLVAQQKAYGLSDKTGSRPQPAEDVELWIELQRNLFNTTGLGDPPSFSMSLDDFPLSKSNLRHCTTGRNIVYLCDAWEDVAKAIEVAYPRLSSLRMEIPADLAVFVYVSNSLLPGRIFGDPFTGQITALSISLAKTLSGEESRCVIAYYPHQVHSQLFSGKGFASNKGITLLRELAHWAIFYAGVAVNLKTGRIL